MILFSKDSLSIYLLLFPLSLVNDTSGTILAQIVLGTTYSFNVNAEPIFSHTSPMLVGHEAASYTVRIICSNN